MSTEMTTKGQIQQYDMKSVVGKLETYMDRVTEKECSPATVQAAVNCADKIIDIFKLHLEVDRLKQKFSR